MSYGDFNPNRIPMFLVASSREMLMALMQANNIVNYKSYNYQTPIKEDDGWVVWYFGVPGTDMPLTEDQIDGIPTEIGVINPEPVNGGSE